MWNSILEKFDKYPAQQKVIKKLLQLGLKIDEKNKIYCDDVEINISSLAKSINTDRRVIISTINNILKDDFLRNLFSNIKPAGPVLSNISKELNLGVIEIEGDGQESGILSQITKVLSDNNLTIRQIYANDPDFIQIPNLTIITDKIVPGELMQDILRIDGVSKVSLY